MSGRKNSVSKLQVVSAGDFAQATVSSSIVNVEGLDNIAFQINLLTGTPTGTFDIAVSVDHTQDPSGASKTTGNFITLGSPYTAAITSGSPANILITVPNVAAPYVKLLYTKTSGTGTFDAFFSGKAI